MLEEVIFLALIHDLPQAMSIDQFPSPSAGTVGYVDNVVIRFSGLSAQAIRPKVESAAKVVVAYMAANFMALNPEKTQLLWICSGATSLTVTIGGSTVHPVNTIDFLGVKFDRRLKSDPHIRSLISATASLAGIARRLKIHLPSMAAADVVKALLVGKLSYRIGAASSPLLDYNDRKATLTSSLQARINDVARAIMGSSRADSTPVADLLERTIIPSVNRLAVRSVAIEA